MTTDGQVNISVDHGHGSCLVCGDRNPWSLELDFRPRADGQVSARFQSHPGLQGYENILHGGIIAALLDAAMTHCLFHRKERAVTAELKVRFEHPISCHAAFDVRAECVAVRPPFYRLRAEIVEDGQVMAWAEGRFLQMKDSALTARS